MEYMQEILAMNQQLLQRQQEPQQWPREPSVQPELQSSPDKEPQQATAAPGISEISSEKSVPRRGSCLIYQGTDISESLPAEPEDLRPQPSMRELLQKLQSQTAFYPQLSDSAVVRQQQQILQVKFVVTRQCANSTWCMQS